MLLSFFLRPLLFCLFVQIPRLESARSELVSDVPVFFLRAWMCARLWIYVCAGLCVLLCAYVSQWSILGIGDYGIFSYFIY